MQELSLDWFRGYVDALQDAQRRMAQEAERDRIRIAQLEGRCNTLLDDLQDLHTMLANQKELQAKLMEQIAELQKRGTHADT